MVTLRTSSIISKLLTIFSQVLQGNNYKTSLLSGQNTSVTSNHRDQVINESRITINIFLVLKYKAATIAFTVPVLVVFPPKDS